MRQLSGSWFDAAHCKRNLGLPGVTSMPQHAPDIQDYHRAEHDPGERIEPLLHLPEVAAEEVTEPGEKRGPECRAERRPEQKRGEIHAADSCRQRNEGAQSRHEAAEKHRRCAVALEPVCCPLEVTARHGEPPSMTVGKCIEPAPPEATP